MNRKRSLPYFRETLSFNAVDLHVGETLKLVQAAKTIGPIESKVSKEYFEKYLNSVVGLGLFGGSGNVNPSTPHADAASVVPRPEDFVNIPYRFISATIVGGESWKATDFSTDGVLKDSLPLFKNTPIFSDHVQSADNFAGVTSDEYYQEAFTADDGQRIPGGISGNASIDTKTNYNLARGILMGAIGSNSVTVRFDWEPSHAFDSPNAFYEAIGTFHKNGEMVRRKVKAITQYYETSMLFAGADPFSKKLDSKGQPVKVDRSSVYFSKANPQEKAIYESEKLLEVQEDFSKELISLSKANSSHTTTTPTNTVNMNKKFLLAFMQAFGAQLALSFTTVEGEELTEAQETELTTAIQKLGLKTPGNPAEDAKTEKIVGFAKALKFVNDKGETSDFAPETASGEYVVMLKSTKDANDAAVTALNTKVTGLEATAALGTNFLDLKRGEAVRLYKVAVGDKYDAAVETLIKDAKPEALDGLIKQYGGEVGVKFSATCTKCGNSDNIEMRSSMATPADSREDAGETTPLEDMASKYSQQGLFNRRPR